MANEEHFSILKDALEKKDIQIWNEWRAKNQRVDLGKANLREADLRESDLSEVNLHEANLREADLSGADLYEADLSGANLFRANLKDAGLYGANLYEADLYGANFSGADLRGADLSGADLSEANLCRANLREVNLCRANLYRANLSEANLYRANLSEADLYETDLSGANLREANLREAKCAQTHFADVDLSKANGLETVEHYGRSYIDFHTLQNSGGNIPEIFMRGCGFSDIYINYVHSLVSSAIDFYSCFISYSHADKVFARRVYDTLQGRGIRCWLDEKQMLPGDDIYEEIDRGIRYWDKVLLCCSAQSLTSWWVDKEINTAFTKEQQLYKDRKRKILALIPLNLDGYLFSDDFNSGKKLDLHSRIAADFRGWETSNATFEEQIESVIKALQTDGGKEVPPEPKL